MAAHSLPLEVLREALDAVAKYGSVSAAARETGMHREKMRARYNEAIRAAGRGEFGTDPVIPGFRVSQVSTTQDDDGKVLSRSIQQRPQAGEVFENPEGFEVDRLSVHTDSDGRETGRWTKLKADKLSLETITAHILDAFKDLSTGHEVIPAPAMVSEDLMTLYPLADLHLGLYAWAPEAGLNWDLAKALEVYMAAMLDVSMASPNSALGIVLIGGDYLHSNTNDLRTRSGNVLDGDGRTDKVIDAGVELAVYQIDMALAKHGSVIVRVLKGNHDEYSSIAIVQGLKGWYRNEPRVTIDSNPDLFWWFKWGRCLLGSTHGHAAKVESMPLKMAVTCAEWWGSTVFRFVHMFHVHHKTQRIFEFGAVIAESHQSPAAQDVFHHGEAYLSGRSMQSITYHKERGEKSRALEQIYEAPPH
jgi:hypothetical protein